MIECNIRSHMDCRGISIGPHLPVCSLDGVELRGSPKESHWPDGQNQHLPSGRWCLYVDVKSMVLLTYKLGVFLVNILLVLSIVLCEFLLGEFRDLKEYYSTAK
jgi:hypothetical protein